MPTQATADYCPATEDHKHILDVRPDNPGIKRCHKCLLWLLPPELFSALFGSGIDGGLIGEANGGNGHIIPFRRRIT